MLAAAGCQEDVVGALYVCVLYAATLFTSMLAKSLTKMDGIHLQVRLLVQKTRSPLNGAIMHLLRCARNSVANAKTYVTIFRLLHEAGVRSRRAR